MKPRSVGMNATHEDSEVESLCIPGDVPHSLGYLTQSIGEKY